MENNRHLRTSKKDFQTGKINIGPFVQLPEIIQFVATEDLPDGVAVTSDGKRADSSIITQRNKIIGITMAAYLTGFIGDAKGFGSIYNNIWTWVPGQKIFLNGIDLSVTPPVSGYSQMIGTACGTNHIDVKLVHAILL